MAVEVEQRVVGHRHIVHISERNVYSGISAHRELIGRPLLIRPETTRLQHDFALHELSHLLGLIITMILHQHLPDGLSLPVLVEYNAALVLDELALCKRTIERIERGLADRVSFTDVTRKRLSAPWSRSCNHPSAHS